MCQKHTNDCRLVDIDRANFCVPQTQQYRTAHQILGLLSIVALFLVAVMGMVYRLIVRSAARRGQQPPEKSWVLGKVHRWVGRVVWVIMLVNNGL